MSLQVPEKARMEIKFVTYIGQRHTLLHWLYLHSAAFIVPFPDRKVNNIYFDTHGYTAFRENLSGSSSRTKVRYRWYGESIEPDAGNLEIKRRRNYFGWKLRHKVPRAPYRPHYNWEDIRRALQDQLATEGRLLLDANPIQVLINRYYRKYFVTSNGKVRATVDTQQAVWDQRFKPYPNFNHRANLLGTVVVEFKFDRKDRDYASKLLQGIPLRVGRHSKYINGVRAIQGY